MWEKMRKAREKMGSETPPLPVFRSKSLRLEPDAALSLEKLSDIRKTRHEIRVLNWQVLNLLQNVVLNLDSNNYRFLRRSAQDGTSDWSPKMGPGTEQSRIMTTSNFIKRGWKILCFEDFPKSSFNFGIFQPCCIECEKFNVGTICGRCVPKNVSTSQKSYEIWIFPLAIPSSPQQQRRNAEWQVSSERLEHPKSVNLTILPALVSQFSSQSWWIVELVRPVPKFLIVAN